jgi:hypothetical protein
MEEGVQREEVKYCIPRVGREQKGGEVNLLALYFGIVVYVRLNGRLVQ